MKMERRRRIGPYQIVGVIARGATSEVLKAVDADGHLIVAIKILSRRLVENPDARADFDYEARALTELDHPNIARLYAAGLTPDGRPYFAMEFVNGRSLMDLILDKVEMSLSQQLDLMIQAAEGLRAALNRNIIHRDIKPANLMVETLPLASPQLRLKIVDFGLAKIIREDAHHGAAGIFLGTPRYMAPEVASGRPADHRSDIYSLGATFYHLLAGRPPFDGETPAIVMEQHIRGSPTPLYLFNPEISADVCEIVEKAMAKDPSHRYQDYDEVLSDLKAAKVARLTKERQDSRPPWPEEEMAAAPAKTAGAAALATAKHTRWRWAILAMLIVAALAGAFYFTRPKIPTGANHLLPALVQTLLEKLSK
jgi:serine/threonine-protein kinase